MRKGSKESKELAFMVYEQMAGKDIPTILERLRVYGLNISAQTLHKWKLKEGWKERTVVLVDTAGFEQQAMQGLYGLLEKFRRHLECHPAVDSQAAYAYANLLHAALRLKDRMPKEKPDPVEMKRVALEILETEFGIKRDDGMLK
ncbi:MAG: hypothetical protein HY805_03215 [Nitrospirae bacterium]|nr:hypothetical protein [Nitrospirota bacterium]